ncbi:MAG TPA: hypothetical protein VHG08_18100 [Longimicrobium sp.]|nr:hypothetical protein [Longimicrobium sp.]
MRTLIVSLTLVLLSAGPSAEASAQRGGGLIFRRPAPVIRAPRPLPAPRPAIPSYRERQYDDWDLDLDSDDDSTRNVPRRTGIGPWADPHLPRSFDEPPVYTLTYRVVGEMNVRFRPGVEWPSIGHLTPGERVNLTPPDENGWSQLVRQGRKMGYVYARSPRLQRERSPLARTRPIGIGILPLN